MIDRAVRVGASVDSLPIFFTKFDIRNSGRNSGFRVLPTAPLRREENKKVEMNENLQLSNVVSPRLSGVNYENCVEV